MAPESEFSVPLIDLSPYVNGGDAPARRAVAEALDRAGRDVGFMQVGGHGIPPAVTAALAGAIDAFFALPAERKAAYRTAPEINRGYTPPYAEALSLSLGVEAERKDYFEAFNVGLPASAFPALSLPPDIYAENLWPDDAAGFDAAAFRQAVWTYFGEAGRVARCLCRIFVEALGVDAGLFERATDHSIDVLRMNHYALPAGTDPGAAGSSGMGAHTDYGIVTVLWADPVPGLQVLGRDGRWHDVIPAEGALLVNLGDLTARWTQDRWRSTLHRVQAPVVDGAIVRRRSAAYFHDGNFDACIETLPSCVGAEGARYAPITVAAHLAAKLGGSRAGIVNSAAGSEAQRLRDASE